MVPGLTNSVRKSQDNSAFWEKIHTLVSVLAMDQKAAMTSALCQARRCKTTLSYRMFGGSRNLKPAGAGEEGAMARAAPGTSRGARAPGPLRGTLAFATKISTC